MKRLAPLLLLAAVSGCASLPELLGEPVPRMARLSPRESYSAGVALYRRGDMEAARREWDRCVALSPENSPSRMDCLVALEELSSPASRP